MTDVKAERSVKKKVSYSQKKRISVKKSQGKVKKIDFFLTFFHNVQFRPFGEIGNSDALEKGL